MKVIICCHHAEVEGEFPSRAIFPRGKKGHNLLHLLGMITNGCFSDPYLERVPAAKTDIKFLRTDAERRTVVQILSDFGQGARYYNLNMVLGQDDPGPSPEEEWQKLEMAILKRDKNWTEKLADPSQSGAIYSEINARLTVQIERFGRSLSRLFTIGGLGQLAKQISSHTHHFLFLMDDQLGKTDYETIRL